MSIFKRGLPAVLCSSVLLFGCVSVPSSQEVDLIKTSLDVSAGMTVADVGAGDGEYAIALAEQVGTTGRVYATELGKEAVDHLREAVSERANIVVIAAESADAKLPDQCCDRVMLRGVYHHLTDPRATLSSLNKALKSSGRLLIVDFPPSFWLKPWTPEGIPENRGGHGIGQSIVESEVSAAGFRREAVIDHWPSGPLVDLYGIVFSKIDGATGAN